MANKKVSHGFGVASLVLGIVSIVLLWFPPVAIVSGVLAIIFAVVQKKKESTGIATAGLVIGIIGTVLNGIILIATAVFIAGVASTASSGAIPLA